MATLVVVLKAYLGAGDEALVGGGPAVALAVQPRQRLAIDRVNKEENGLEEASTEGAR